MGPPQDFKSLQEGIQKSLVSTVKTVNRLASEDLSFQRTVNPDVAENLDDKTTRVLELSTRLLQSAAKACGVKPPTLEDAEDIDMRWPDVVGVVDSILEKADTALDEYTGLVKRKEPPSAEPAPNSKRSKSTAKVIRNANVIKPQAQFERKPDNFPTGPWKPMLTKKPHATVPLDQSFIIFSGENGAPQHKHPYEAEISSMTYPDRLFQTAEPIPPQPADTTSATWVDTYEGVLDMLKDLKKAKEIAVDLEHHDFRTYTGLVCLMQISTREKDWIVDTLRPWRHKLEVLNEVFADPRIVKVFHGAYMDMVWLQRDLGLYVNGLFDTFFACDLLAYPGKSLAFLLSKFVGFDADKQYQLADWRIRPIPAEMMYYARSDTHYLLYIYDQLRNELIAASDRSSLETDYIGRALQRSKELALSRHEHLDFDEETGQGTRGWYNYILKQGHLAFGSEQFAMFRAIWRWRDVTARREDENPNFVLGTNNVVSIVRVNPPDAKALHSLLPLTAPLARARFNEIWSQIQEEIAQGGPSMLHFFTSMAPDSVQKPSLPIKSAGAKRMPELDGEIAIRSMPRSQLFGNMPISTRWEAAEQASEEQDGYMPFPWQRFVQGVSGGVELPFDAASTQPAEEADVTIAPTTAEVSGANTDYVEVDGDEEFTLKKGRKQKKDGVQDEASESVEEEDEASGGDKEAQVGANGAPEASKSSHEKNRNVGERKAAHAKKRADRAARKAKKQEEREGEAPFDYSKASSVMHANRNAGGPAREPKKVFDPCSKTGDDPLKGARKAPPVRGERSATFRK
ncbi:Exosome complex exonuclease rrp6 [Tolypocladium ophioglossoides CBS 100239]|uniref:Exosome complex exonuclease rrp6 n=1 Tax=Tolypocladium ophioglossoides (strain CBS 100239) TaxID=1163406 RepID=A0A0L0MY13_TOLOC|nr:Exosome complex exonuclease rrp6 [Tolypocladium ophioglossoides CBS 100239]